MGGTAITDRHLLHITKMGGPAITDRHLLHITKMGGTAITDRHLLRIIAREIGDKWEEVGVALGLYYSTVRNVAGSHGGQRSGHMHSCVTV